MDKWIGHKDALRKIDQGDWTYQSTANRSMTVALLLHYNVSLLSIDARIEELEAENTAVGRELRKARAAMMRAFAGRRHKDWDSHLAHIQSRIFGIDLLERAQPYVLKALLFGKTPRGQALLYRWAESILRTRGKDCAAKEVFHALSRDGHVTEDSAGALLWTDAQGHPKKTTMAAFETRLSALRNKLSRENPQMPTM